MRRYVLLALAMLGGAACEKTQPTPPPAEGRLEPIPNPHGDFVAPAPLPDPEMQGGGIGRAARRITVAQLGTSIEIAAGRPWSQLDTRATSMGRADFALVNTESIEPNLVFAKFLEDGAREVCLAQASAEMSVADPNQRVLSRTLPTGAVGDLRQLSATQVNELLVYLSTRFWGSPLQGEELTRWAGFFTRAASTAETKGRRSQALAAVCIAMMTDERFLTY